MKAYILIHVRPGAVPEVVRTLRKIKGVVEANMTFGPYDVVAIVEVVNFNALGPMVASEIQPIPGVMDTLTCLVVDPA
jgi:DNA-binding Lrp family transcriptional regulator